MWQCSGPRQNHPLFFPWNPALSLAQDAALPAMLPDCQNQMFLIVPLSSLSCCLSAGLAFTPASCPADPLSLSWCPSFCNSHSPLAPTASAFWATPATGSHHGPPPPSPLGHFRLLVPASSGFFFKTVSPSHVGYSPLAGLGDSWREELQHVSWPPSGSRTLVFGALVLAVLHAWALSVKQIGPA